MSYPTEKLGKYIDILSGFAFKSKDFSNTGVPVIKIKNITPPYVSLEDVTYVPNDIATQQKKFQVHYGDILIALTGSHINVTNQECGIICSIDIPANCKRELINQLNLCGINEKFIYPGMDGIGRYIKQKYSSRE